ncbi:MAG: hypothetical protein JKY30_11675 [Flavobacteriales bacterium]|nr:hypothetical protein [Flavobacteriales bacterium]
MEQDQLMQDKVSFNKFFPLLFILFILGCENKQTSPNRKNQVNDQMLSFSLQKEFNFVEHNEHDRTFDAHSSYYLYKNENKSVLKIEYEFKPLSEKGFVREELEKVNNNFHKMLENRLFQHKDYVSYERKVETWNKYVIQTIGGKECIYFEYTTKDSYGVEFLCFTDSLHYVSFEYLNHNKLGDKVEINQILNSIIWD